MADCGGLGSVVIGGPKSRAVDCPGCDHPACPARSQLEEKAGDAYKRAAEYVDKLVEDLQDEFDGIFTIQGCDMVARTVEQAEQRGFERGLAQRQQDREAVAPDEVTPVLLETIRVLDAVTMDAVQVDCLNDMEGDGFRAFFRALGENHCGEGDSREAAIGDLLAGIPYWIQSLKQDRAAAVERDLESYDYERGSTDGRNLAINGGLMIGLHIALERLRNGHKCANNDEANRLLDEIEAAVEEAVRQEREACLALLKTERQTQYNTNSITYRALEQVAGKLRERGQQQEEGS